MSIALWACVLILIAGITIFVIGVIKAIRSKFYDLTAIIWCFGGNVIMYFASFLAFVL